MPELYNYQKEGVQFLCFHPRSILADSMGMGKTVQAIQAVAQMGARRVLVVCPNSVKSVWTAELEQWYHAPDRYRPGQELYRVIEGSRRDRDELITRGGDPIFTIINYDLVGTRTSYKLTDNGTRIPSKVDSRHMNQLTAIPWDAIILDESHRLINRKSKTFEGLKHINRQDLTRPLMLLTGTPIINRPEELWASLHLIDPKQFSSFWKWVYQECNTSPNFYSPKSVTIDGVRDPDGLRERMKSYLIRREKQDNLELPMITIQDIYVDLDPDHMKMYKKMKKELHLEVQGQTVESVGALALATRLRQLSISPEILLDQDVSLSGAKIETLLELIDSAKDEQKIVVFSQFARVIRGVSRELKELRIKHNVMTGETPNNQRGDLINSFNKDSDVRVFLTTISCGGVGIDLTAASIGIFVDYTWSPSRNDQAICRLYRNRQKRPVTIYALHAKKTIEEVVQKRLKVKNQLFEDVIPVDRRDIDSWLLDHIVEDES